MAQNAKPTVRPGQEPTIDSRGSRTEFKLPNTSRGAPSAKHKIGGRVSVPNQTGNSTTKLPPRKQFV